MEFQQSMQELRDRCHELRGSQMKTDEQLKELHKELRDS